MKVSTFFVKLVMISLLASGCVSQQSFRELEEVKNYYQGEAEAVDSISIANQDLADQNRELELTLKQTMRELEELAVANNSLARNYEEILAKYNQLVRQQENELTTYSYEKIGLQEQLAAQQSAIDEKDKELANLEYELYQKESRLDAVEYDFNTLESGISERDEQIAELKQLLNQKDERMQQLRQNLNTILRGFSQSDLSVTERNGKIYVSMSQNLLFRSGSNRIDPEGRRAIQQLSRILANDKNVNIVVEGHTDSDGSSETNWDLSVARATAVVKLMTDYGVDPKSITASGKGEYAPVAPNATYQGKALNRRTEIILAPKLDELYDLLNR